MTNIETGGPAFPELNIEHDGHGGYLKWTDHGMTLHDYFMAAALQGMLAYSGPDAPRCGNDAEKIKLVESASRFAYFAIQARKENK